jgi:hypothetical protein
VGEGPKLTPQIAKVQTDGALTARRKTNRLPLVKNSVVFHWQLFSFTEVRMRSAAPRRPLSPFLLRAVVVSNINQDVLRRAAGWPNYPSYFVAIRSPTIIATELAVSRLTRLAEILGFPKDQVFLDEPPKPRLVKVPAVGQP